MQITSEKIIRIRKPKTSYPVIEPIAGRFSPRNFSSEKIPENDLNSIFEAARLAPSAYNYQPWFYYWTRIGSTAYQKIISCLPELNYWAKTAPVLIVACYLKEIDSRPDKFSQYDLGASVISLILQAQQKKYYARQMGLFDRDKLVKILNINKDHHPFVIIALGKIGDYSKIKDVYLKKDFQLHVKKTTIVKKI
jgi:nitroreductase